MINSPQQEQNVWELLRTYRLYTETKMSSFWWNFHHWLHWKLSKWQLPVQPVIKISSKWRHFRFRTLKRKCLHFDEIFITGFTGSCQNDNFQCSQWLKFRQNDDIFVSVFLVTHVLTFCRNTMATRLIGILVLLTCFGVVVEGVYLCKMIAVFSVMFKFELGHLKRNFVSKDPQFISKFCFANALRFCTS